VPDPSTGLTHIGAREYDPTTATFLSGDPILQTDKPQTLNGYSYGVQNPYTYADPTGTQIYDPVIGLGMGNSAVLQNYYRAHNWINKHGHYTPTFYHSTSYKSWHHESTWLAHHWHSLPSSNPNPSHVNTDSGENGKKDSENKAWYEKFGNAVSGGTKWVSLRGS
jgi:RHS repeat-associated protein